jgi:hypothetical protein
MPARAEVLAGLNYPKTCKSVELAGIRPDLGGGVRQEHSAGDSDGDRKGEPENEKTPSEEGVSSFLAIDFQEVRVDVSIGGGGNCTRVPRSVDDGLYVCSRSFDCRPQGPDRQGPLWLILS